MTCNGVECYKVEFLINVGARFVGFIISFLFCWLEQENFTEVTYTRSSDMKLKKLISQHHHLMLHQRLRNKGERNVMNCDSQNQKKNNSLHKFLFIQLFLVLLLQVDRFILKANIINS